MNLVSEGATALRGGTARTKQHLNDEISIVGELYRVAYQGRARTLRPTPQRTQRHILPMDSLPLSQLRLTAESRESRETDSGSYEVGAPPARVTLAQERLSRTAIP